MNILQLTTLSRIFAVVFFLSAPISPASEYRLTISCFTESRKTMRQVDKMHNWRCVSGGVGGWSQIRQQQKGGSLPFYGIFTGVNNFKCTTCTVDSY
jgi:hypothetical protein